LSSLTINGPDSILTRTNADYLVTATLSDQTTQTVAATWNSDNTSRATVSPGGRVSSLVHGPVTLTASYQGQTVTKTVNMISNYDGPWSGVAVKMTCRLNGDLGRRVTQAGCPAGPNERYSMQITVSQPGPTFTQVTAVINLAAVVHNLTGTVSASDGRLVLGGDTQLQMPDPRGRQQTVRWSFLNWDMQLGGFTLTLIIGRFDRNRTESLWPGNIYDEWVIEQMRRVL
jgi:hypothetical protein